MTADQAPRVSVVIPTRDRCDLVLRAVASVEAQSIVDWECLVVDDGSTDDTAAALARQFGNDPRVRYLLRPEGRGGATVCRNLGWRAAHGAYVVFLDSDDVLHPDCLEARIAVMDADSTLDLAVFDGAVFQEEPGDLGRTFDSGPRGDDLNQFLTLNIPWDTSAPIWRRDALAAIGGWDETLASWQDIDLHVRALARRLRYRRVQRIDHDIRWASTGERISHRKAFDVELIRNCQHHPQYWAQLLTASGLLSSERKRLLAGITFHVSWQLAGLRCRRDANSLWRSARAFGVTRRTLLEGRAILLATTLGYGDTRIVQGLVRRWKSANGYMTMPAAA